MTPSVDQNVVHALLDGLTSEQEQAVRSDARRLLIVAGAGSGKTEVMARRIAWWVAVEGVSKDEIIAFTFTEKAAEEMKFRIRKWIGRVTPEGEDATLGRMFVGTMHGFALQMLQELMPDQYGVFDVIDDAGRIALIQGRFNSPLGLQALKRELGVGKFETINEFLLGYDILNEYGLGEYVGPLEPRPAVGPDESDWIKQWSLHTDVGSDGTSEAFARSAARYHGTLQARRLFDFSTVQSELIQILAVSEEHLAELNNRFSHVVVDEFQDINPVQDRLIRLLVGETGVLTAVGDHRQAIYAWRGGRVDIMADWHAELSADPAGTTVDLPHNFRSTRRIIDLSNKWAKTITSLGTLATPDMKHGRTSRTDQDPSHVAFRRFEDRHEEATWIAETINRLVDRDSETGAPHDVDSDRDRGIGLSDIAVLVRSGTDIRTYMEVLEGNGVPAVVRGGPDLFKRPEVLLLVGALSIAGDIDAYFGGKPPTMASIASDILHCDPKPEPVLRAAAAQLAAAGLPITDDDVGRLVLAAEMIKRRLAGDRLSRADVSRVKGDPLRKWLLTRNDLRRIYPQTLYQWLAAEAGIARWNAADTPRAQTALFHLGQLSGLVTGIEMPGWVRPGDLKWHIIALTNWGARSARTDEAPLLVPPDAITITTIHSAKGLEFPVVFLADVKASRFPSNQARRLPKIPFDVTKAGIDPTHLADNDNYDAERRLMYVALTRAERYLFVTTPGGERSRFTVELAPMVDDVGGENEPTSDPAIPPLIPTESDPAFRLVTSFSDLRYYLECPHDYYLRKVLGFAPTIDQAFGYGRGVHNLMRAIHLDAAYFAGLDDAGVEAEVQRMIDEGLFYLRYTTGEPLENMKRKAESVVADYVSHYRDELGDLEFEPERAFETLIEEAGVLVSGAIDLIRHDDPPTVTLIDFKSGNPDREHENVSALDAEQMQLQVSLYALAAKKELEYEPDLGLVRYLGVETGAPREDRELDVPLGEAELDAAKTTVIETVRSIQDRVWGVGPQRPPKDPSHTTRCQECDFVELCGRPEATAHG